MAATKESEKKKYTAASILFNKTLHLKPLRSLMEITQLKWKQPIWSKPLLNTQIKNILSQACQITSQPQPPQLVCPTLKIWLEVL